MALKTVDQKGRLTLGQHYAGKLVEVEEQDNAVVVTPKKAIPEHEAWLWENDAAIAKVRKGLDQVRRGQVSNGPDLDAAFALADDTPDDDE